MRGARVHDEGRLLVPRRLRGPRARVPEHARHLLAHLHAARPRVPRGRGRHRRRSAAPARTSSTCSPIRARTRSPTAPQSDYAANVELAEAVAPAAPRPPPAAAMTKVPTPGKTTLRGRRRAPEDLPLEQTVKAIVADARRDVSHPAARARRSRAERDQGAASCPSSSPFRFATEAEIARRSRLPGRATSARSASTGDSGDRRPQRRRRWATSSAARTRPASTSPASTSAATARSRTLVADIRNVVAGRPQPRRQGHARDRPRHRGRPRLPAAHEVLRGDEGAASWTQQGKSPADRNGLLRHRRDARSSAAAIEQNHDERGIVWPRADGAVHGRASCRSATTAARRSAALPTSSTTELAAAGIDVLLDDRDERPGVMFADSELIGIPHRVVIGDRGLKDGNVEYQGRRDDRSDRRRRRRSRRSVRGKDAALQTCPEPLERRRIGLRAASRSALLAALPRVAGAQQYEPLSPASVRSALAGDRRPGRPASYVRGSRGRAPWLARDVATRADEAHPRREVSRANSCHRALRSDARRPRSRSSCSA